MFEAGFSHVKVSKDMYLGRPRQSTRAFYTMYIQVRVVHMCSDRKRKSDNNKIIDPCTSRHSYIGSRCFFIRWSAVFFPFISISCLALLFCFPFAIKHNDCVVGFRIVQMLSPAESDISAANSTRKWFNYQSQFQ